jgi:hypothetical protein
MNARTNGAPEAILSCHGLELSGIRFPSFSIGPGDALCVRLPILTEQEESQLEMLLTGRHPNPALRHAGRINWVEPVQNRGGFLGRFRWLRATDWLVRAGRVSHAVAEAIVERLCGNAHAYVEQLAGNMRMRLALEAVYSLGTDLVIFGTRGCDPLGTQAIQELVLSRLYQSSALYLARPYWQENVLSWPTFPGSKMIEAQREQVSPSFGAA